MGIIVNKGEEFKTKCPSCGELVHIIATGVDIVGCPYCCNTLCSHSADEKLLSDTMRKVSNLILQYRNTNDSKKKAEHLSDLKNQLYWLNADIQFLESNNQE